MDRFQLQYVYVLLLIVILQSCGTCSHRHVGTNGAGVSQVSHGREVWSTLSDVGYPIIPDTIVSRVLERYCYTASHNKNTRQPNWVMWQLTGEHVMNKKEGCGATIGRMRSCLQRNVPRWRIMLRLAMTEGTCVPVVIATGMMRVGTRRLSCRICALKILC